jgi:hypothetical protein
MHDEAFLTKGKGGNPNEYEPVLAERKAIIWMSDEVKEKASVPPFVDELVLGNRTERNSAKYEWPGGEGNILLPLLALFPDMADRFQLPGSPLRDSEPREVRSLGRKTNLSLVADRSRQRDWRSWMRMASESKDRRRDSNPLMSVLKIAARL